MTTTTVDALETGAVHHPDTTTTLDPTSLSLDPTYPKWINQKFKPDGTVLPFPGNTILCHLSPNSELYTRLLSLYKDLQAQSFAPLYVLLPPTSWHMTLSEGVCDQIREVSSWPAGVSLDVSLQTCNEFIRERLVSFDLACELPFRMTLSGWEPLEDGIALTVTPATDEETSKLRDLRDRLAEHLGLRHPGHDEYSFHISLAYTLRYLSRDQIDTTLGFLEKWRGRLPASFELEEPEFCVFEDMFAFRREGHLGGG